MKLAMENEKVITTDGTTAPDTTNPQDQVPANPPAPAQPFKSFATKDEYETAVKSERSKAQNDLLKEIGIQKVQDAKDAITKYAALETQHNELKIKANQLEETLTLKDAGIKDEYREEALTLAKAKVNEKTNLAEALKQVIAKMPIISSVVGVKDGIGGDRQVQDQNPKSDIDKDLSKKYGIDFTKPIKK